MDTGIFPGVVPGAIPAAYPSGVIPGAYPTAYPGISAVTTADKLVIGLPPLLPGPFYNTYQNWLEV